MLDSSLEDINNPLVSVGIPTYNRPEGLRRTLECITGQTYKNLEIIVSDNCSPNPDVERVGKEFAQKDPRVQYFRQKENFAGSSDIAYFITAVFNFQFVLEKATGEYFMWAADDDNWDPRFISTLLKLLESNKTAVIAFPHMIIFDHTHPKIESHPHLKDTSIMYQLSSKNVYDRMYTFLQVDDGKCNLMCGLMRMNLIKIIKKNGVLKKWGMTNYGTDILMIFRLLNFGEVVFCEEILFFKQISEKKEDSALKSRIGRFIFNHFGKLDCFLAYIPIIKIADISTKEKIILSLLVFPRILKWMLSLIINAISRILKIEMIT